MKNITKSLIVISAVAALAIGGTIAYFSDTETSTGNTFTAGTLDLQYRVSTDGGANWSAWQNGTNLSITLGNLAPGGSGTIIYQLNNLGSVNGFLDFENVTIANTEGLNPESETGSITEPGELGENSKVIVTLGGTPVYTGTVNGLATWNASYPILAGGLVNYALAWNIPPTVGNEIQGDIVTIGVTFELAQTTGQ